MILYLLTLLTFCRAKDLSLNIQGFSSFGTTVNTTAENTTKELESLFKTSMTSGMILDAAEKDSQVTDDRGDQMGAALEDAQQQAITGQDNSFPQDDPAEVATFAPPPDTGDEEFNKALAKREADLNNEFVVMKDQSLIFYRGIALGAKHSIESADYMIEESRRAQQEEARKLWAAEDQLKYYFGVKSNKDWKEDFDRLQEINRLQKSVYLEQHAAADHFAQVEFSQSVWNENIFRTVAAEKQEFEKQNRIVHQHVCKQVVYLIETLEALAGPQEDTPCHDCAVDETEALDSCSYRNTLAKLPKDLYDEGELVEHHHDYPGATDFASARADCWSQGLELESAASSEDISALAHHGAKDGFETVWVGLYKPRTSENFHTTVDDIQQSFNPLAGKNGFSFPGDLQSHTLCIIVHTKDGSVSAGPCYHDAHDFYCH